MVFQRRQSSKVSNMSSIPQGAFASLKVKENRMKAASGINFDGTNSRGDRNFGRFLSSDAYFDQPLLKYNSKLMNSIWGLYNRYSVHNFKKNAASETFAVYDNQRL